MGYSEQLNIRYILISSIGGSESIGSHCRLYLCFCSRSGGRPKSDWQNWFASLISSALAGPLQAARAQQQKGNEWHIGGNCENILYFCQWFKQKNPLHNNCKYFCLFFLLSYFDWENSSKWTTQIIGFTFEIENNIYDYTVWLYNYISPASIL